MAGVLFGAVLYARWNALVRAASDKFLSPVLVVGGPGYRPHRTPVLTLYVKVGYKLQERAPGVDRF
ncbi:MAG TPA: hypothetical protein VMV04_23075 [Thermodesulfobacteriota bacterium]|nr:hypothetical protein [Thermodesulfobacteriota bacterium]